MALTPEQELAITQDGPIACVAQAGSGKTAVLAHRFLRLLDSGIPPRRVFAATFTTDAAAGLRERIVTLSREREFPKATIEAIRLTPSIGTLHGFCYRLVDAEASRLGLLPISSILKASHWYFGLSEEITAWRDKLSVNDLERFDSLVGLHSARELASELYAKVSLPLEGDEHFLELLGILRPLIDGLRARFRMKGIYGFDELEELAVKILEMKAACDRIHSQFDAILVDEFQDTSPRQLEIIRLLVGDSFNKLFVVGDPKQSIYRFRGADSSVFAQVLGWCDPLELKSNFRSQQSLLGQINRISEKLIPGAPMHAARPATIEPALSTVRYPPGESSEETTENEFATLELKISEILATGSNSVAVLFRQGARIPLLKTRLQSKGILVQAHRAAPLFASYSALDIAAYLEACFNPLDDSSLSGFLRSQFVGLSLSELWKLKEGSTIFESLVKSGRLKWFVDVIESRIWDLDPLLESLFLNTGPPDDWGPSNALIGELFEHTRSLPQAVRLIQTWKAGELRVPLDAFSDSAPVRLATVHSVKGLEFDHVLIVDCLRVSPRRRPILLWGELGAPALKTKVGADWVPSARYQEISKKEDALDDEESKRVLYVALTRARETLTVFLPDEGTKLPERSWATLLQDAIIES